MTTSTAPNNAFFLTELAGRDFQLQQNRDPSLSNHTNVAPKQKRAFEELYQVHHDYNADLSLFGNNPGMSLGTRNRKRSSSVRSTRTSARRGDSRHSSTMRQNFSTNNTMQPELRVVSYSDKSLPSSRQQMRNLSREMAPLHPQKNSSDDFNNSNFSFPSVRPPLSRKNSISDTVSIVGQNAIRAVTNSSSAAHRQERRVGNPNSSRSVMSQNSSNGSFFVSNHDGGLASSRSNRQRPQNRSTEAWKDKHSSRASSVASRRRTNTAGRTRSSSVASHRPHTSQSSRHTATENHHSVELQPPSAATSPTRRRPPVASSGSASHRSSRRKTLSSSLNSLPPRAPSSRRKKNPSVVSSRASSWNRRRANTPGSVDSSRTLDKQIEKERRARRLVEKKLSHIQSKHDKLLKNLNQDQQRALQKMEAEQLSELSSIVIHEDDELLFEGSQISDTTSRSSRISSAYSDITDLTQDTLRSSKYTQRKQHGNRKNNSLDTQMLTERLKKTEAQVEEMKELIAALVAKSPASADTIQVLQSLKNSQPNQQKLKKLRQCVTRDYKNVGHFIF